MVKLIWVQLFYTIFYTGAMLPRCEAVFIWSVIFTQHPLQLMSCSLCILWGMITVSLVNLIQFVFQDLM